MIHHTQLHIECNTRFDIQRSFDAYSQIDRASFTHTFSFSHFNFEIPVDKTILGLVDLFAFGAVQSHIRLT